MESRTRVCPFFGRGYTEPPALSRRDNATDICPDCGMLEALASIPLQRQDKEVLQHGEHEG